MDSNDRDRVSEARGELHRMLSEVSFLQFLLRIIIRTILQNTNVLLCCCRMNSVKQHCLCLPTSKIFQIPWVFLRSLISLACIHSANAAGKNQTMPHTYYSNNPQSIVYENYMIRNVVLLDSGTCYVVRLKTRLRIERSNVIHLINGLDLQSEKEQITLKRFSIL